MDILHYSSSDSIKLINNCSSNNFDVISSEENSAVDNFITDHDHITQNSCIISDILKEINIYIAGFVVFKLTSVLHCKPCVAALYAINKDDFLNSFIAMKNKDCNEGGLTYPSDDVILLCFHIEKILVL